MANVNVQLVTNTRTHHHKTRFGNTIWLSLVFPLTTPWKMWLFPICHRSFSISWTLTIVVIVRFFFHTSWIQFLLLVNFNRIVIVSDDFLSDVFLDKVIIWCFFSGWNKQWLNISIWYRRCRHRIIKCCVVFRHQIHHCSKRIVCHLEYLTVVLVMYRRSVQRPVQIIMFKLNMKCPCRWYSHFGIHHIIRSGISINGSSNFFFLPKISYSKMSVKNSNIQIPFCV